MFLSGRSPSSDRAIVRRSLSVCQIRRRDYDEASIGIALMRPHADAQESCEDHCQLGATLHGLSSEVHRFSIATYMDTAGGARRADTRRGHDFNTFNVTWQLVWF